VHDPIIIKIKLNMFVLWVDHFKNKNKKCLYNDPIIIQIKLNMFVSYVDNSKNNNKKCLFEWSDYYTNKIKYVCLICWSF